MFHVGLESFSLFRNVFLGWGTWARGVFLLVVNIQLERIEYL
jgi:hypothetical protein